MLSSEKVPGRKEKDESAIAEAMLHDINNAIGQHIQRVPEDLRLGVTIKLGLLLISQGAGNTVLLMGGEHPQAKKMVQESLAPIIKFGKSHGETQGI